MFERNVASCDILLYGGWLLSFLHWQKWKKIVYGLRIVFTLQVCFTQPDEHYCINLGKDQNCWFIHMLKPSKVKSVDERNNHFVWLLSTNQNREESGREVVFITTGKILTFLNVSLRSWSPLREVAGCLGLSEPLLDLVINKLDKGIILK